MCEGAHDVWVCCDCFWAIVVAPEVTKGEGGVFGRKLAAIDTLLGYAHPWDTLG